MKTFSLFTDKQRPLLPSAGRSHKLKLEKDPDLRRLLLAAK